MERITKTMITKEQFIRFIKEFIDFQLTIENISRAICGNNDLFFDCDWMENVGIMFDVFIDTNFNEEASDLIMNRIFESDYKEVSPEEIWEELKDNGYV